MLRKIEQLRKAPKHVHERYALYGAVSVTAVIALVWLVSLPARFEPVVVDTTEEQSASASAAWAEITEQFRDFSAALDIDAPAPAADSHELDVAAIFAATSTSAAAATELPAVEQRVLIGTTSSAAAE